MKFNRQRFFEEYLKRIGKLSNFQKEGLSRLLDLYEKYYGWWDTISEIANSLSQVKLESAHSYHAVAEGYYLSPQSSYTRLSDYYKGLSDRVKRFQQSLRYFPHFGRGHIQLTWLHNYTEQTKLVKMYFSDIVDAFEMVTKQDFDLVKHPEQMFDFNISFAVMTIGMQLGKFTGKRLSDYDNNDKFDHYNARDIVNGDKRKLPKGESRSIGKTVEVLAIAFEKCLKASLIEDSVIPKEVKPIKLQAFNDHPIMGETPIEDSIEETKSEIENAIEENLVEVKKEEQPKQEIVAVEKTEPKNFGEKLKSMFMKYTGLNIGWEVVQQGIAKIQEVQQWNIVSSETLTKIGIVIAVATVLFVLFEFGKHLIEVWRDKHITETLVTNNSTPTNIVRLVDKSEIANLESKGVKVVTR